MSVTIIPLTPDLQHTITAYLRAGGFAEVCAEAAGVPADLFTDWMGRGEGHAAVDPYADLARSVRQGHAQSRLGAEVAVRDDRPLDWLLHGPGRETPRVPGWTAAARPRPAPADGEPELSHPHTQDLVTRIRGSLSDCPGEARASVADWLEQLGPHRPPYSP